MVNLLAAIVTIVSGLITIAGFLSKKWGPSLSRPSGTSKVLASIGIAAVSFLIIGGLYFSYSAINSYFSPKWTEWEFVEMPATNKEGRTKYYTAKVEFPKNANILDVDCKYSWEGWNTKIVEERDAENGIVKCTGGHRKHDVGRTLLLRVCYSRWSSKADCPDSPEYIVAVFK